MTTPFAIAGRQLSSRLILGTGGFTNHEVLAAALNASGAELCTVALRRLGGGRGPDHRGSILEVLDQAGVEVLPNTAGCYTARDAIITAQLARSRSDRDGEGDPPRGRGGMAGARRRPDPAATLRRGVDTRRGVASL